MKLIIDIPEVDYECAKQRWMRGNSAHQMDYYVSKGTPLDDLRADLHATAEMHDDGDYYLRDEWIDEYFDDIGEESEDEE